MPESISLPINLNEVNGLIEELSAKVSRLELAAHIEDTDNPHLVTAVQIGAELTGAGAAAASQAIAAHETTTNHPLVSDDVEITGDGFMRFDDKLKLDTIQVGATANATDAQLRARNTHTGTQAASTIEGLGSAAIRNVGTTTGTVAAGDDGRLTNARTPTGTAGGVLSGSYPNPSFAAGVFARSLGNPGWEKLHSGKVHEWGSTVVTLNANGDGAINLPLTLSTGVQSYSVVNGDANAFGDRVFSCNTASTLATITFSVRPSPGAVTVRVNWNAIGV